MKRKIKDKLVFEYNSHIKSPSLDIGDSLCIKRITDNEIISKNFSFLRNGIMSGLPLLTDLYDLIYYFHILKDNVPIGFITYNKMENNSVYLRELRIYDKYRNQKIGNLFIKNFIHKLQELHSFDKIEIECMWGSEIFWEKCGFKYMESRRTHLKRMFYNLQKIN